MKKSIKKYLAKLQENDKKGFSLVELIIVMAIMAILVGVVASQVIPYMEKSRQSKDQQVISALLTDINSAIAQSGEACAGAATGQKIDDLATVANAKTVTELLTLRPEYNDMDELVAGLKGQLKSKEASGCDIYMTLDATSGELVLYISSSATLPTNERMIARSKETSNAGS